MAKVVHKNFDKHNKCKVDCDEVNCFIPSKRAQSLCSEHKEEELELYCETCDELICFLCTIRKHNGHRYDLVSEVFERQKDDLNLSLKPVEQQMKSVNTALAELDERCEEISNQQAAIEKDIERTTKQLHEVLNARKTKLIGTLHQIAQRKLNNLAAQRDQIATIQTKLGCYYESAMESLKSENRREVLDIKTSVAKQVKQLTYDFKEHALDQNTEADMKFSAPPDLSVRVKNYGQVYALGAPDPSKSHAEGKGLVEVMTGLKSTIHVQACNFKGEPCKLDPIEMQCKLESEQNGEIVNCTVTDIGAGLYEINYCPVVRGKYQLHITISGQHINESPFTVKVKEGMFDFDSEDDQLFLPVKERKNIAVRKWGGGGGGGGGGV